MAVRNSPHASIAVRRNLIAVCVAILSTTVATACGLKSLDDLSGKASAGGPTITAEGGASGSDGQDRSSGGDENLGGLAGDGGAGNAGTPSIAGTAGSGATAGEGGAGGVAPAILGYALKVRHTEKCLDVNGPTTLDGNRSLGQVTCNGSQAQTFEMLDNGDGFMALRARGTGTCADVERRYEHDNANIILWNCHGEINQLWQKQKLDGPYFQFVSRFTFKCLDVQNGSSQENAAIVQNTCSGSISQAWETIPIDLGE